MLFRLPDAGERSVGAFGRVSFSPDDRNPVDFYADGGINVKGLFPSRPDDNFGVGFGYARISDRPARFRSGHDQRSAARRCRCADYEAVLEVTYQAQIVPGWTLQPDFQYIIHPGGNVGDPDDPRFAVKNAAVFGLRSVIRY